MVLKRSSYNDNVSYRLKILLVYINILFVLAWREKFMVIIVVSLRLCRAAFLWYNFADFPEDVEFVWAAVV